MVIIRFLRSEFPTDGPSRAKSRFFRPSGKVPARRQNRVSQLAAQWLIAAGYRLRRKVFTEEQFMADTPENSVLEFLPSRNTLVMATVDKNGATTRVMRRSYNARRGFTYTQAPVRSTQKT